MSENEITYYRSPIGVLQVCGSAAGITFVGFVENETAHTSIAPSLRECVTQLDEYFNRARREFSCALDLRGTVFQTRVWRELLNIPHGKTTTYREIALALGDRHALRAVGRANGQNPISIIVPCHRVIGSDGSLTGYGGGLWRKEWLLHFEGALNTRVMHAPTQ